MTSSDESSVKPPKRKYVEDTRQGVREVDAADRAIRIQALVWSIAVATLVFAVSSLGVAIAGMGRTALYLMWLGGAVAGAIVYRVSTLITTTGSTLFGRIQNPTGRSTPPKREYSRARSLVALGHFHEAIRAYELAVADYPDDPEPYLGIARIYRDHLEDLEQAVTWFKRARASATMHAGLEILVTQEIIEIFRGRLRAPSRSIPELARLIQRFPNYPSVEALRAELVELRRRHVRESNDERI